MANQQLVDYIKQQLQLGVQKEAIKSTLLASGWPDPEVADAFQVAAPASSAPAQIARDIMQPKAADPSAFVKKEVPFQAKIDTYQTAQGGAMKVSGAAAPASFAVAAQSADGGMKRWMMMGGGVVAAALLAGGLWYFYSQSNSLADDKEARIAENNDLSRQITALMQEKSNLQSQVNNLTESNNEMAVNLTFVSAGGSTNPVTNKVKGILGGDDKTPYTLTTSRGLVLNIKNYKDPKVNAVLKPLLGQGILLGASYVPGSRDLTVVSVNDVAIESSTPAATSTPVAAPAPAATSTPPATTSTPTSTPR